mmetsp:Transcript_12705/g.29861  ORF Transcript_12705/g.29861 Transcript_12705/m.29861 type:complete len:113 (-) Transcript_12705:89-427(-)|eukprot:CAMPEP_0178399702 /NCGR_PEP_ID=MMETSP0689_2-20121128/15413_1 /TAXON_ID=160604 /ORGANISM="Amphidinium massartii, Strain CS-259" /LENGTH=112 /DNA_ID=CAMNT_0020020481 /DNA_START=407 /DNA_END=745 /DNA_ORIENTATION=+
MHGIASASLLEVAAGVEVRNDVLLGDVGSSPSASASVLSSSGELVEVHHAQHSIGDVLSEVDEVLTVLSEVDELVYLEREVLLWVESVAVAHTSLKPKQAPVSTAKAKRSAM